MPLVVEKGQIKVGRVIHQMTQETMTCDREMCRTNECVECMNQLIDSTNDAQRS